MRSSLLLLLLCLGRAASAQPLMDSPDLPDIKTFGCNQFDSAIHHESERSCVECVVSSGQCMRAIRNAKLQLIATFPIDDVDVGTIVRNGHPDPQGARDNLQSGAIAGGFYVCIASDSLIKGTLIRYCHDDLSLGATAPPPILQQDPPAASVTPEAPPPPSVAPPPPPHRDEASYEHKSRGISFALELGAFDSGDGKNIYSSGLGRGWMLGYGAFEFRIESYDLSDQTKTYDNVANASGRAGIYSIAWRPAVFTAGPIELVGTLGVALVTRPSLRDDPDDVDFDIVHLREQWGGALVVGGGVRIYDLVTVDVRAYPTAWSGISGNRAEADDTGKLVMTPLADSPGGVPLSINAGIGMSF